ncbi:HTH-type transcriptional regulator RutR [Rouxiella chamberiensis]|uniref:HTH-type transcriptional regulator RutR n=1 Tax=Rouxiella chamberiensis TaxID=1513468 RepID=A0ABY7HJY6_9GAMM|nr:HTH-type transcriptional regulator RutR [Rouxiella chamberiensis]WAS99652.1 HTH-type transcriptional regulator RutR [Rouxiella chamberiensis]
MKPLAAEGASALKKPPSRRSRAVAAKRNTIMAAALEFFSLYGLHGTSLDQVAERADVSKTNLLYYFPSKEELYVAVLRDLLDIWLEPLKALSPGQEPMEAIKEYIYLKLCVSRDHPQASRLFCLEMLQGAPLLKQILSTHLKQLVEEKSAIIEGWVEKGLIAPIEPLHLLFILWATTQHYADFGVQIEAISGQTLGDNAFFEQAVTNLQHIITQGIRPQP